MLCRTQCSSMAQQIAEQRLPNTWSINIKGLMASELPSNTNAVLASVDSLHAEPEPQILKVLHAVQNTVQIYGPADTEQAAAQALNTIL